MNLEELVKSLNERCKTYGLRAKPTTLLELPFGNCSSLFVLSVMNKLSFGYLINCYIFILNSVKYNKEVCFENISLVPCYCVLNCD